MAPLFAPLCHKSLRVIVTHCLLLPSSRPSLIHPIRLSSHNPMKLLLFRSLRVSTLLKPVASSWLIWLVVSTVFGPQNHCVLMHFLTHFPGFYLCLFLPSALLMAAASFPLLRPACLQSFSCQDAPKLSLGLCPLFTFTPLLTYSNLMASLSTHWWLPQAYFQRFIMTNAYFTSLLGYLIKTSQSTCPKMDSSFLPQNQFPLSLPHLSW